jgi:drug/metabolite transporter (DMT)-like permease
VEVHAERRAVVSEGSPAATFLPRSDNLRGIVAMACAVAAFSGMDTLLKLFSTHYPPMQVSTMRGLASLPFMIVVILATGRLRDLKPVRFRLHLLRGMLSVVMIYGFVHGVRELTLANTYAIYLSAPLLIAALSVPLLREHIGWRRWTAICVGLVGVMVILRPSASSMLSLGAVAIFISAITYAISAIIVSVLARTDTAIGTIMWQMILLTVFAGALAIADWQPVQREHLPWLVGVGIFGALGQWLITMAFRTAPPSVVAPFEYTALLWGVAIDWTLWGALPSSRVYVGGGIVIASGLYLIWRERMAAAVQPAALNATS